MPWRVRITANLSLGSPVETFRAHSGAIHGARTIAITKTDKFTRHRMSFFQSFCDNLRSRRLAQVHARSEINFAKGMP